MDSFNNVVSISQYTIFDSQCTDTFKNCTELKYTLPEEGIVPLEFSVVDFGYIPPTPVAPVEPVTPVNGTTDPMIGGDPSTWTPVADENTTTSNTTTDNTTVPIPAVDPVDPTPAPAPF